MIIMKTFFNTILKRWFDFMWEKFIPIYECKKGLRWKWNRWKIEMNLRYKIKYNKDFEIKAKKNNIRD